MDERKPWWPKLKSLPLFTSSAEWEAQLGANDQSEIEPEEEKEDSVRADPATKKADDK